jgi:Fe2+ or Zn2+ uptake regulation protein
MNNGWIKLHRQLVNNEIFRHDRSAWHVFEYLLLVVDRNNGRWSGGRHQLAELTGIKAGTVYKCLQRLQDAHMVTLESNNRYTVIHICNWIKYQDTSNSDSNNTVTSEEHLSNNTVTLLQEREVRIKKENNTNVLAKAEYGNPEINEMLEYWQKIVGFKITSKVKQNRNACNNLIKKHSKATLEQLIRMVGAASTDRYSPRISDFVELQAKTNELVTWAKKQSNNVNGVKL